MGYISPSVSAVAEQVNPSPLDSYLHSIKPSTQTSVSSFSPARCTSCCASHDVLGEHKTAENLFCELENIIGILQGKWDIIVVAITSDAGGEALKVRKMARRKHPHLVTPDCFCYDPQQGHVTLGQSGLGHAMSVQVR
jgi:hypothetical protein